MYSVIQHQRLDSPASSILFSNIPQNFSDLVAIGSLRATDGSNSAEVQFNGATTNRTTRGLYGNGSSPFSYSSSTMLGLLCNNSSTTANTFGNSELYIPNYTASIAKSSSHTGVNENNATLSYQFINANLWNQTAAITSLTFTTELGGNFSTGSSITLYGINRTQAIGRSPQAMGGYITYANGYWVHTFTGSGSFIPFNNMEVEYLVIAGGGGGGAQYAGGGGAGGYRSSVSGESSGGGAAAEAKISLSGGVNYPVTVGSGGAGVATTINTQAINGSNSSFHTVTSIGGGAGGNAGGAITAPLTVGKNGGSGGGVGNSANGGTAGAGTAGQGYAGGGGSGAGGGGGGAGGSGGSSTAPGTNRPGGPGVASSITGTAVIRAAGGIGIREPAPARNGEPNTGNGGDGAYEYYPSGNGGSGIVIIRYKA
jgi:hypothetical protein